jgi:hypothetical protein
VGSKLLVPFSFCSVDEDEDNSDDDDTSEDNDELSQ